MFDLLASDDSLAGFSDCAPSFTLIPDPLRTCLAVKGSLQQYGNRRFQFRQTGTLQTVPLALVIGQWPIWRIVPRQLAHSGDVKIDDVGRSESAAWLHAERPSLRPGDPDQCLYVLALFQVIDLRVAVATAVSAEVAFRREVGVLNLQGNPQCSCIFIDLCESV